MALDPLLTTRLIESRKMMEQRGKLVPAELLDTYLGTFRARFGPDQLRAASGRALLELIHLRGNRDSLVYWLEFKDDDEFATRPFGSIAGGNALKFGIYQRADTGVWTVGSAQNQQSITEDEAIRIAEGHRTQLLAGVARIQALAPDADQAAYAQLQNDLDRLAPDVSAAAWGHKYFSLLAPERIDDYHSFVWQRFMLLKLLRMPPADDRRYEAAYWFKTFAQQLGWRIGHLTGVLNERFGEPHRYWRVGTTSGNTGESQWARMRDRNCIAVGYNAVGDLSDITPDAQGRDALRGRMAPHQPNLQTLTNQCTQLFNFVANAHAGDIVVAADCDTIIGIGRITGEYAFEPQFEFKHVRPVSWVSFTSFTLPEPSEVRQSTFRPISRASNVLAVEQHLLGAATLPPAGPRPGPGPTANAPFPVPSLSGVAGRIQAALERKGQVILYGPPGTGKTFQAERVLRDLAAHQNFNAPFTALSASQHDKILGDGAHRGFVRLVSFHPGYGYEDFVEGYRPSVNDGKLGFAPRDGIFKQLCNDALALPDRRFYLLIDEINRADVPRVLGELMTVLELDKREKAVVLPLSGTHLRIPANIRIVGTMNTADRSIALLDAALRRRFAFVELMPDYDALQASGGDVDPAALLRQLNARIREHVKRDARNLQVGHAYLLEGGKPITDARRLARVLQDDVIPLVQEYCYDDADALRGILGTRFVATDGDTRPEVFERVDEVLEALAQLGDDVVRATSAVAGAPVPAIEEGR